MDFFDLSARILSTATDGATGARIIEKYPQISRSGIRMLLNSLVDKNLLEVDSSSTYWTTINGAKFLEIRFNIERMLKAQSSLV